MGFGLANRLGRRTGRAGLPALGVVCLLMAAVACSSDDDGGAEGPSGSADEVASAAGRGAGVAMPTATGPIAGGSRGVPYNAMPRDLAERYGYVEEEYFLEGTATAYEASGVWQTDGRWDVQRGATAPYKVRIIVRRPGDNRDFSGNVLVEWLNVTRGSDSDADFAFAHDMLLREGWVHVGVSAQRDGVEGRATSSPLTTGLEVQALKQWDPERYDGLAHPGDAYSYDIYSQAARALRSPGAIDPLDGLVPRTVIASGDSQSAIRLTTYVNAIHRIADIYDGFFIHNRTGSGASLGDEPRTAPDGVHIRTDLADPVFQLVTESELFPASGYYKARQDDSDTVITWEAAGTAHADRARLQYEVDSTRVWDPAVDLEIARICGTLNDGQQSQVVHRALQALSEWILTGDHPPRARPIEAAREGQIMRDEHGNALGGVRTPAVEVPIAVQTGEPGPGGDPVCLLVGQEVPFDPATLHALYTSHRDYVDAVADAADAAVADGFLDAHDAEAIVDEARTAAIPP